MIESLLLNFEETLFLNYALNYFKVHNENGVKLSIDELWEKFNKSQSNFFERYVIYHYYRTKGWIVKSGIKYGGDYLLYKEGPLYSHASYLIKIFNPKQVFTWTKFLAINRLVETFNKV